MSLMDNPAIGGKLNSYPFRVLTVPDDAPELLTSDRPVVRNHSGLSTPEGHIAISIGPRKLFVTASASTYLRTVEQVSRRQLVLEMNRQVVQHAKAYVYGRTDKTLRFVQKHFATLDEPRLISMAMIDRMKQRPLERPRHLDQRPPHALLASPRRTLGFSV